MVHSVYRYINIMASINDQPSNIVNIIIIGLILVSGYLLYSLTLAFYKDHQIDVHITDFEERNEKLLAENKMLLEEINYVTSEAYIDKILKQNQHIYNPGEEVIIIPDSVRFEDDNVDFYNFDNISPSEFEKMSNTDKWKLFIFQDNPLRN